MKTKKPLQFAVVTGMDLEGDTCLYVTRAGAYISDKKARALAEHLTPLLTQGSKGAIVCTLPPEARALLAALGNLGTQDLYTDAEEYENRVGGMQGLCLLAAQMANGDTVTLADIEASASASDDTEGDE
jgi:hypothetical protein